MFDPTGTVIVELREDAAVAALTDRVRGGKAAPGDAKGAQEGYERFIVVSRLGYLRHAKAPLQTVRLGIKCYGTSDQDAAVLAGAASDAIHHVAGRLSSGRYALWASHDDGSAGVAPDPDTQQPFEALVAELVCSTEPLP